MALTPADYAAQQAVYLQCKMKFGFWSGQTPPTQFYPAVNFSKLELTNPKQEVERLKSNMEGSVGQDLATVSKPVEDSFVGFAGEFSRAPMALLALSIGSVPTELSQTGGTKTDQAVTLAVGIWVPLPDAMLASFTSLKTASDVAVEATHYEVDLVDGMIMALDATGATGTKATYVTATVDGVVHDAGQVRSEYVQFRGTATDKNTAKRGRLIIHRANVASAGAWDVVGGSFLKGALEGSCETPTAATYTRNSPYQFVQTDIAA